MRARAGGISLIFHIHFDRLLTKNLIDKTSVYEAAIFVKQKITELPASWVKGNAAVDFAGRLTSQSTLPISRYFGIIHSDVMLA